MKELDKLVDQKSYYQETIPDDDQYIDIYLDNDQRRILEVTKCLIRGHSTWKMRWDLVIMIMAVFNWFAIPVQVSFEPETMNKLFFRIINSVIDICFLVDMIINFRTTYLHPKTGNEIINPRIIFWDYLKGRFWVDFLASAPFDLLAELILGGSNASAFRLFSLFKLVRVLRLNRLITVMKVEDEIKLSLKLCKLVFFLVMYLHCLACTWYFIVMIDKVWLPPLDYVWVKTDFYNETLFFQYCSSVYHAVLMLTGNDLGARNSWQLLFVAGSVTLGAIINANIFGELAVILSNLNRKATQFQSKLDIANTAMKNLSLPEKLQVSVTGFLTYSKALLESQEELECFLRMISPSLKEKVLNHLFKKVLLSNPIFLNNDSWVEYVTRKLDTSILLPEFNIINQGEKGESLYFISKGEWVVYVTDHRNSRQKVNRLGAGSIFGEVALLCKRNRTATVKTVLYSTIAQLNKRDFDTVCRIFSDFQNKLKQGISYYTDSLKTFILHLISDVDYFKPCSQETIEEISYYMEQSFIDKDNVLFREGDEIDRIYFIINGKINITVNINGIDVFIDALTQGCSIGCNGVLGEYMHNFTARAASNTTYLWITKDHLQALINSCEDLDNEVHKWKEFYENSSFPYVDFR